MRGQTLQAQFDDRMSPTTVTVTGGAVVDVLGQADATPAGALPLESAVGGTPVPAPDRSPARWRVSSEQLVIDVAARQVVAPTAGSLSLLKPDGPAGAVTWQEGARLDLSRGLAEFTGDVTGDVSGALLRSQSLKVEFDDGRRLRHIWAQGAVQFAWKAESAWEMQSETARAVFAGDSELKQVIAEKDVRVRDQGRTLDAQLLELFFEKAEGDAQPTIQRAVAQQAVKVSYEQEERVEAGGDRLEWDRSTDTYVLIGAPDAFLRRGSLMVLNSKIMLNRTTGKMDLPPGAQPVRTVVPLERTP